MDEVVSVLPMAISIRVMALDRALKHHIGDASKSDRDIVATATKFETYMNSGVRA